MPSIDPPTPVKHPVLINRHQRFRSGLAIQFLLCSIQPLFAADYYVSPAASGNGTLKDPGSLATAMAHTGWAAAIAPGDTVYLRAGTYTNGTDIMYMNFNGAKDKLVTWRNYPKERAIINHPIYFKSRDYHRFRGLEFLDTNKKMRPEAIGYFDSNIMGHYEWINCIIHDTPGVWTGGSGGSLISGCIIWYAGKHLRDHIVYPHTLSFSGNIVGWTSGNGIELGTDGIQIRSNIMWGGGVTVKETTREMLVVFPGVVDKNCLFGPVNRQVAIHVQGGGALVVTNNIVCADAPLTLAGPFSTATVTGNTLYSPVNATKGLMLSRNNDAGKWTVNDNAYYARGDVLFMNLSKGLDFATWKSSNPGYDKSSTASPSKTPPDSVSVFPNAHESKRAHIAIYNWTQAPNVTVDVSGVLAVGDKYELYSAQDFLAGPIKTGVVSGKTISVPMANLTVAPVLYCPTLTQPKSTSPNFGAFVLTCGTLD
ncbi:MAG: hypothetical protein K8T89_10705 [Planctomycetes bacterium]|nr:hypothetical protein [Planctomycetota bacterium]